jgi:hypothetical protein
MNATGQSPGNLSPLERYQVFRNRIEHEDNLIMQRLSWLMASQSFLFTAYAIVSNGMSNLPVPSNSEFVKHLTTLGRIVPIVALLNSLLIAISIFGAMKAIWELRDAYRKLPQNLDIIPMQTSRIARRMGLGAPILLPLLFLAVWSYLLLT